MKQAGGYLDRLANRQAESSYAGRLANRQAGRVQELCESRGGRPGLSVLTSFMVSVDAKQC